MKNKIAIVSSSVVFTVFAATSLTAQTLPECKPNMAKDAECALPIKAVHLTQYAVGKIAMECKRGRINDDVEKTVKKDNLNDKKAIADGLNQYLLAKPEKRIMPVVIGPNDKFYITDHHHLGTAVWTYDAEHDYDRNDVNFRAVISKNWRNEFDDNDEGMEDFWMKMKDTGRAWFYNENGEKLSDDPKEWENGLEYGPFPKNFGGMQDDPFRTISRWVREACGYLKEGKSQCDAIGEGKISDFMEFRWANYMRSEVKLEKNDLEHLLEVYPDSVNEVTKKNKPREYFQKEWNGDVDNFGFNDDGDHLQLQFDDGCERWYLEKDEGNGLKNGGT